MDEYVSKPLRREPLLAAIHKVSGLAPPDQCAEHELGRPAVHSGELVNWPRLIALVGGDRKALVEVVRAYHHEICGSRDAIARAVRDGDAVALFDAAHKLKSALKFFGLLQAVDYALRLETIGRSGDLSEVEAVWVLLESELARLLPRLEEFCAAE